MRSHESLRSWVADLLPAPGKAGECPQSAAHHLVRALMVQFTTELSQLARQTTRDTSAAVTRQNFERWLAHRRWRPDPLYAGLSRRVRKVLAASQDNRTPTILLIDVTFLADQWAVLQISLPWERRALPLYRVVYPRRNPPRGLPGHRPTQTQILLAALTWLRQHLPGPPEQYVLVMDRGFPGHRLLKALRALEFRYVIRVQGGWSIRHPEYTGFLQEAGRTRTDLVGPVPRLLRDARLGQGGKGAGSWSEAHVVFYRGPDNSDTWVLLTAEPDERLVVAVYAQRKQIECEFRDLKGPYGLDLLARWQDVEAVAAFLAWMAVYEWRLAWLWVWHRLKSWGERNLQIGGRLSWIRITREWLRRELLVAMKRAPVFL